MAMLQVLNPDLYITPTILMVVKAVLLYGKTAFLIVNSVASLSIPGQKEMGFLTRALGLPVIFSISYSTKERNFTFFKVFCP